MKPDYLTPDRAAELIAHGTVPGHLLCPHCRHVLYVGVKNSPRGEKTRPRKPSPKGASRSKRPT